MAQDWLWMTASDLGRGIARGEIDPVALTETYLDAIDAHGGTINQFQGDSVMAIFNTHDDQPDHAIRAVRAGIDSFWANVTYRPEPFEIPAGLKPIIERNAYTAPDHDPVLIRTDLDEDGIDEYVFLMTAQYGFSVSLFYFRNEDGWQTGSLDYRGFPGEGDFRERVLSGELSITEPRYKNLEIGGVELRPLTID